MSNYKISIIANGYLGYMFESNISTSLDFPIIPDVGDHIRIPDDPYQYIIVDRLYSIGADGSVESCLFVKKHYAVMTKPEMKLLSHDSIEYDNNSELINSLLNENE